MGVRIFSAIIALAALTASNGSHAACGHYLLLAGPATPKKSTQSSPTNKYTSPAKHYEKVNDALTRGINIPGLVKIYEKPVPLDFMFEIYAESYPRGEEHGALWHIRPRETAYKLIELEGDNYIKLNTENDERTEGFFRFFHRKHIHDKKIGDYWAARESPELFETLKEEWNFFKWPGDYVDQTVRTTGADRQLPMAKLRAESYPVIGVATPHIAASYIVTASGIPDIEVPNLQVDPQTGRVTQYSSLATHDWRELDSAVWIDYTTLNRMKNTSRVWLEIHKILKNKNLIATDRASKKLSQEYRDFADKEAEKGSVAIKSGRGFTEEGAAWWRLAEIEIYRSQRVFHSFNHLLSELIRNPSGIPRDYVMDRYGPIHQREFSMHLSALGLAAGKAPAHLSPLIKLTFEEGTSKKPLTLEAALDRVINNELDRLKNFSKKVPDPEVKELIRLFLLEYEKVDPSYIKYLANDLRKRFKRMGEGLEFPE